MTEELILRRAGLAKAADGLGLEWVMVCDPTNLFYLSGLDITPYERFAGLFIETGTAEGSLLIPSLEKDAAADPAVRKETYTDDQDPFPLAAQILGGCRSLGIEKTSLPVAKAEGVTTGLENRLGGTACQLTDIGGLIDGLRLIKGPGERERLKTAVNLGDKILGLVQPRIRPGQTETGIAIEIIKDMDGLPGLTASGNFSQVLAGTRSSNPHGVTSDYAFEKGDPVTIDFGVRYSHYWSDCTRTFFIGPPAPRFREIYETVLQAQLAALEIVGPGVVMAEVDRGAREVITRAGFGRYFTHRIGHGLGLSIHEAPSMHGANRDRLREGMVVTVEPGIYIPGLGGVRIEDDVYITADGAEILTGYPKEFEDMVLDC